MLKNTNLIVFSRAPEPGKVKTRLIASLGVKKATALYTTLLKNTLQAAAGSAFEQVELHIAGNITHPEFQALNRQFDFPVFTQQGNDLGARMYQALSQTLQRCDGAVLVGCDCAELTAGDLDQARDALSAGNDVVLGPSTDGGYYLIGMETPHQELFVDMEWSTKTVLQESIDRAKKLGLTVATITEHTDIDDQDDLASVEFTR